MLGGAPKGEVNEERLIMDVDGAELPFPDNSVDVGTILLIQFRNFISKLEIFVRFRQPHRSLKFKHV